LNKLRKILVFGVGGPTPRSFVRSIKESQEAFQYTFIGVDSNYLAYGLYSKELFYNTYLVPDCEDNDYWDIINQIIETEQIDAAIVLPEKEVLEWSKNYSTKLKRPIKYMLPDYNLVFNLVNKHRLYELLEGTEFVPKFLNIDTDNYNYNEICNKLTKEFWIRAPDGSSGLAAKKIANEADLHKWFMLNPTIDSYLASEFLPKRNIGCILLYHENELISASCFERVNYIMSKVAPSGITGNVSYAKLLNESSIIEFSRNALEFISKQLKAPLNGPFTVDIKEDYESKLKITEINVRYIAPVSCFAAGGANIPLDHLQILFNKYTKPKPYIHQFDEGLVFHREVDFTPILMQEKDLLQNKDKTHCLDIKKNILITSVGRRVSLMNFFKEESRKGYFAKVLCADANSLQSSACQLNPDSIIDLVPLTQSNYKEKLLDIVKNQNIGLIIPTIDTELAILSDMKNTLQEHGCTVIVSERQFVETCENKEKTAELFLKFGIKTPKILDKNKLNFPCFVRPRCGSLSKNAFSIPTVKHLSQAILDDPNNVFTEYFSNLEYNEYTVDMYYSNDNRLCMAVPRRRIEVRGGEISKGITHKLNTLLKEIQKMAVLPGAVGVITAQFFVHKISKEVYGIEINARFGGGYPLSYFAGANYPKMLIEEYFGGQKHIFSENWKEDILFLRYDSEVSFYSKNV
jgi:hypothetical protein